MILFVSEINALSSKTTSTHILTDNIICGLKQNGYQVGFVAIYETDEAYHNVKRYYSDKVDSLYLVKSRFGSTNSKYKKLFHMLKGSVFWKKYQKAIPAELSVDPDTILVSHTPSMEAAFFCRALKNKHKGIRYIQYWSDPVALSGIMPEDFNIKRYPFYYLEKHAYRFADEIVFGTKTLHKMNAELYPESRDKMRHVDWAYNYKEKVQIDINKGSREFIYAGNYYTAIRNIKPLYDAFNELGQDYQLCVYGSGDLKLANTENVKFHDRVSPETLAEIEGSYRNTISLMNHSCMQVPGKTFYQTDTDQLILVIVDGSHGQELKEYLGAFDRFVLCDNEKDDIKRKILSISETTDYRCPEHVLELLSPKKISCQIIKGVRK